MYGLAARRATRLPAAAASLRSATAAPVWTRLNSTASGGDAPVASKAKRVRKPKATPAQANAESSTQKPAANAAAPSEPVPTPVEAAKAAPARKTATVTKRKASASKGSKTVTASVKESVATPVTSEPPAQPEVVSAVSSTEVKATTTAEKPASSPSEPVAATPTPAATLEVKAETSVQSKKLSPVSPPIPLRPTVTLQPYREHVSDPEERAWHSTVVHGRASLKPYRHPAPYKVPVATIHFRSHFPRLLDIFTHFVEHAAAALAVPVGGTAKLPTRKTLWTVIRGPFVHKKSQENFERRVHKRAITAYDADPEVVDRMMLYLKKHSMAGVGMRVARWHRVPVGIGRHQLEAVAGRMKFGKVPPRDQILQLGQQVIAEETKAATEVKAEDEQVVLKA
ncbi:hypothetical protein PENSPDRAFT_758282 [Peniophora sp. CONT]|nr:hypothetical protein PENSPDRAFT_758282 [Peniophora sp. CONT]